MGNFLGKKGEPASRKGGGEILDRDRAVLDLKVSRDKCKKYQVKLEAEADKLKAKAAALLRQGQKDRALLMMKIRKMRMTAYDTATKQLLQLEEMTVRIGSAANTQQVVEGLKQGNEVLKGIHQVMSVVAVDEVMDDLRESQAIEDEIASRLGEAYANVDQSEVEAEYAAMIEAEGAAVAEQLPDAPRPNASELADSMPEAPTAPIEANSVSVEVAGGTGTKNATAAQPVLA